MARERFCAECGRIFPLVDGYCRRCREKLAQQALDELARAEAAAEEARIARLDTPFPCAGCGALLPGDWPMGECGPCAFGWR